MGIEVGATNQNIRYLRDKRDREGHLLSAMGRIDEKGNKE